MNGTATLTRERQDLLETLAKHRGFLRQTIEGMSPEQIRATPTVSALSLGAILQHVTEMEVQWGAFIDVGAESMAGMTPEKYAAMWTLDDDVTAESLARRLRRGVRPQRRAGPHRRPRRRPRAARGALVRARCALVGPARARAHHRRDAQHAGHADIIRESIDGQKTMG